MFDKLGSASLVSVANSCDNGCKVVFDQYHAHITKGNELSFKGYRNWIDGLWDVRLPTKSYINNMSEGETQQKYQLLSENINQKSSLQRIIIKRCLRLQK